MRRAILIILISMNILYGCVSYQYIPYNNQRNDQNIYSSAYYSQIINANPDVAWNYVLRANAYTREKEFSKALDDLNKALRMDANDNLPYSIFGNQSLNKKDMDVFVFNSRGIVYVNLGDNEKAASDAKTVLTIEPNNALAHLILGESYFSKKEYDKAILTLSSAISLNVDYRNKVIAHTLRSKSFIEKDNLNLALKEIDYALTLDANNFEAYLTKSRILRFLKDYNQSEEILIRLHEQDKNNVLVMVELGLIYRLNEEYDKSLKILHKAFKKDPNNFYTYLHLAYAHKCKANYKKAIDYFEKTIRIKPKYKESYIDIATIYTHMGEYEKAEKYCKNAIDIDRTYIMAYVIMAQIYRDEGKIDNARTVLNEAKNIDKNDSQIYIGLGKIYIENAEYEEALKEYNKALSLENNSYFILGEIAQTYFKLNQNDLSIEYFKKSIEKNDKYLFAYTGLANVYNKLDKYWNAIKISDKAIEINPKYELAYFYKASAYENLEDYEYAINNYTKSLEHNPKYLVAYFRRGISYKNNDNAKAAIKDYSFLLDINNLRQKTTSNVFGYELSWKLSKSNILIERGKAFLQIGDKDKAYDDFTKVIEIDPNSDAAYRNIGSLFLKDGLFRKAIQHYKKAVDIDPENPENLNSIAWAYVIYGKPDIALKYSNQAIKFSPKNCGYLHTRGSVYLDLGLFEKALIDFDQCGDQKCCNPYSNIDKSIALFSLGHINESLLEYEEAIKTMHLLEKGPEKQKYSEKFKRIKRQIENAERPLTYTMPVKNSFVKPRLFVLTIGISEYEENSLNLKYADKDASVIARFFEKQPRTIFREIHTNNLINSEATRSNIIRSISEMARKASTNDVALIFLSGHALKYPYTNTYYFLTNKTKKENIIDQGISEKTIEEFIITLSKKFKNLVILVDTCHSGAISTGIKSIEYRNNFWEQFETEGLYIISASRTGEVAIERDEWGHGAFTYSIIHSLNQESDINDDGIIDILELFRSVDDMVVRLTDGLQHPYIKMGGSHLPLFCYDQK